MSRSATTLAGAVALALLAGPLPLVDSLAHRSLAFHMTGQHVLLVAAGVLGALAGYRPLISLRRALGILPALTCLAAALLVGAWHVPWLFDLAMGNSALHGVMHLSYVGVGFALTAALPALTPFGRVMFLAIGQAVMGTLGVTMYAQGFVYQSYPSIQTNAAGVAMTFIMPLAWVAVLVVPKLSEWIQRLRDPRYAPGVEYGDVPSNTNR